MAVISKEELIKKVNESSLSDDEKISFMEDITDSWSEDVNEEYKARYEAEKKGMEAEIATLEAEAEELKARYKERFMSGEVKKDIEEDITENKDEIIDVKEI
jgi:tRNA A37 N6-isopentenylltransferase MiaA